MLGRPKVKCSGGAGRASGVGQQGYGCGASENPLRFTALDLSRPRQQVRVGQLDRSAHDGCDLPVEACRFGGLCGEVAIEVSFRMWELFLGSSMHQDRL